MQSTDEDTAATIPFVAVLPSPAPPSVGALPARAVPDVRGLSVRKAAHVLHEAGFRVQLVVGTPGTTDPSAGRSAPARSIVRLAATP